jgi:hypothetical protein
MMIRGVWAISLIGIFVSGFYGLSDADSASYRTSGGHVASVRPALGLKLGETTLENVQEWADLRGINCSKKWQGIFCHRVEPRLVGDEVGTTPIESLIFSFDRRGHLESVDVLRSGVSSLEGGQVFDSLARRLKYRLGKPTLADGERVEYDYKNYAAFVSAKGSMVHERYLAGE